MALLVNKPLVLVSQIQRSGGSLIAQLFDAHPQCLAHPFEIHIGFPQKWQWPVFQINQHAIDEAQIKIWFGQLFEKKLMVFIQQGYAKPGSNAFAAEEKFEFDFSIDIQWQQFLRTLQNQLKTTTSLNSRNILDAYFDSFFKAWRNHQPTGKERIITGFTPRINMYEKSTRLFFNDYDDGKLISIIRDPLSWYASSHKHNIHHQDIEFALNEWLHSTQSIIQAFNEFGETKVLPISYQQLLNSPQTTMEKIAHFSGIDYSDCLLTPSFLGQPVKPNSSFQINSRGINRDMLLHHQCLNAAQIKQINALTQSMRHRANELLLDTEAIR